MFDKIPKAQVFKDVDRAIEWAEDDLLRAAFHEPEPGAELALDQAGIIADFSADEIAVLKSRLTRVEHARGSIVFSEGDPGNDLFIITKGTASAYIHQPEGGDIRLVTFAPGTVFGELAILDPGPRSATVVADEDLVTHALGGKDFAALSAEVPAVAIKLLASLGRELSRRLRRANRTIHQLEV